MNTVTLLRTSGGEESIVPSLSIRLATPADIPAMAVIRALTWGPVDYWRVRIADYAAGRSSPRQALAPRGVFVAVEGEALVGLIAGHLSRRHGCDGELEWIDVVAEKRGSGVAGALLSHLSGWFEHQQAARVCVDVAPWNRRARRFYERHGARELNEHWLVWDDLPAALRREGRFPE